ncbi:MAG: hypothetical protein M1820_009423 [Bogoriella megaspora]|nr:MAG: hypothetical protein M1820_009423 [Bogoriella megaspora]
MLRMASFDGLAGFGSVQEGSSSNDHMQADESEPQPRRRKQSWQEVPSGIKTVMRRASVTAKSWKIGKRKSKDEGDKNPEPSRRGSDTAVEDPSSSTWFLSTSAPVAPPSMRPPLSSWGPKPQARADRWAELTKWHPLKVVSSKGNQIAKHDSSIRIPPSAQNPPSPLPGKFSGTPNSLLNVPAGGDAARASAAAATQQETALEAAINAGDCPWVDYLPYASSAIRSDVPKDNESGVCVDLGGVDSEDKDPGDVDGTTSDVSRKDFIKDLPAELAEHILSFLDAKSLASVQLVNKRWRQSACSRHVWRHLFLSEFSHNPYPVRAPLLPVGSLGLGRDMPRKNWQLMYKARKGIEKNWRTGNGKAVYLSGHTDSVYCVQFDDKKLITGSRDRTIRVWDLHHYKCLKVVGGPSSKPTEPHKYQRTVENHTLYKAPCVNGSPYGSAIFHAPRDFHSASVLCLQYDSEIMVTGSSDNTCIVWDIKTFQPIRRLFRHTAGVLDICFDHRYIISCSKDFSIVVWDRHTGAVLRTLIGHRGPVNAVQLRGNLLVSASGDGVARLWNVETGNCVREFASQDRGLAAVEFSDDGRYVLAGGNDQVVYKFDALTGGPPKETYTGHEALVRSLFLDTRNNRVISGSYDLSLRVYDYEKRNQIAVFPQWTTSWMLSAKSDYRRIVSTSQDGRILIVDFGYDVEGAELLEDSDWAEGFEEAKSFMATQPQPYFSRRRYQLLKNRDLASTAISQKLDWRRDESEK